MRAFASYLILLLAMPLAALAVVLPANVYRAQGIAAPDCDGPLQVLIFAVPAVLIYGAGALLAYRAGRRFHRLVSLLCLVIALAAVPNIAEAVHELYRNAADGECRG
ncbi:hypothetical protein ACU8L5_17935 [Rhizobium leguminosarum]|jgi:hypothetical protein|uniref:Integral membrane protein n=1 Tax=Rhizobium leguminosarum TaxID=384 RepID=A0A6P0DK77_RHILE|nr:hypothetical protein [Rhizobium leguminosarum]MDH6661065.1 hypothetical protein [Rhizobium sophorae]AVC51410.1 putative membrane protein [Rhizobium leguminosarum bv. viciae]MBB4329778.1 hypothetical protein [Rhizobium leguminosarum]MBB4343418.1 hypothetical protein [Rhizobium leguminosarum]MBB4355271.1 hypothetical protein [Rhizobium leguminosarum]